MKLSVFSDDELLRPISIMFIASFIGGACNYVYQLYMGRLLGPEDYGIFGSFFAISYIMFILAGTIRTSSAKFVSKFVGEERNAQINFFLTGMLKRMFVLGSLIFFILVVTSPHLISFLKVDSITPVFIIGSFFFFTFLLPVNMGVLQGLQRFLPLGFYRVLNFSSKLFFGVLLVSLGFGVNGALAAVTIGAALSLSASFYSVKPFLSGFSSVKKPSFNFYDLYLFSLPTMLTMFCFAVPANVDVIIAKHFFSAQQAGLYTAASVLGKVVLFIPEAIAMVMFPKVSEATAMKTNTLNILNKSLIYTGLLSGGVTLTYWWFPSLAIRVPFGYEFLEAAPLVKYYGVVMFLFSLSIVVMRYCLAMHDLKYVFGFSLFTFIEIGLLSVFHETMMEMIRILLMVNIVLFIFSVLYIKLRAPKLNKFS